MSKPILTLEDTRSPTWRKVREYSEAQLRTLRAELESDVTPERTAKLRGRIQSHVFLLALGNPPAPALEAEPDDE